MAGEAGGRKGVGQAISRTCSFFLTLSPSAHCAVQWKVMKLSKPVPKLLHLLAPYLSSYHLSGVPHLPSMPLQAKIGDFGLLREMDTSSSQMNVTAVVGTPGFVDPAYVQSQYATPSADVYRCVGSA